MGWKDLSSWLKGGIIGAVLALIIVAFVFSNFFDSLIPDTYNALWQNIFLLMFLMAPIFLMAGIPSWSLFIICPLIWFGLGVLIGWIFGKQENKLGKIFFVLAVVFYICVGIAFAGFWASFFLWVAFISLIISIVLSIIIGKFKSNKGVSK
jgi:hypothetical protein